jgi:tripartite-type tricarboxylate transporter receptor subunit TctC
LAGELIKFMAGVDTVDVDLIIGSIEHIRAGRLRALAVTTATRSTRAAARHR